jgi:hypothetical protein
MVNVNYRAEAGLYHRVIGGVGDERYNEAEIRQLYDSEAYPLKRHTRR